MKVIDYHVHSTNSFDGKSSVEDMCKRAIEIGDYAICFTEHFSVDPRDVSYGVLDYEKYENEVRKAQEKFGKQLDIKMGLEIGEPHLKEYVSDLILQTSKMQLDFIIGSVHNIDGVKLRLYMQGKNKYELYYEYFQEIYKMVSVSDIDVIGHLDLMKRYAYESFGNYEFEDYREIIEKILKTAILRGIGLEINGSGYLNSVSEPFPKPEVLQLYRELGGEIITIGSDSHACETLSKNNKKMSNLLKEIGFKKVYTFDKRKKIEIKI
ncbi:histidinol-phosphatase HisJ family protein [Leptotrichia sp. HSP-342]|uniref:Histidinol-phosphatase n=1 Tax=Leptotrichia mesophila TaxID=3239303 RepID=A0AB39VD17_9FUSO